MSLQCLAATSRFAAPTAATWAANACTSNATVSFVMCCTPSPGTCNWFNIKLLIYSSIY